MEQKIISFENPNIKYASKLLSMPKFRKKQKEFVIEGARLCEDALISKIRIIKIFYTNSAKEKYSELISDIEREARAQYGINLEKYIVTDNLIANLSDTATPQGIVCLCSILDKFDNLYKIKDDNRIIALENIQDPSNLGTILRTAEALGINSLILSKDCCDIYNPKVIRGSMGAIFRLAISFTDSIQAEIINLNERGWLTCAAVVDEGASLVTEIDYGRPVAVFIGNEGNGLTEETIKKCELRVKIPMKGKAESLNAAVAASIIMWEMMR